MFRNISNFVFPTCVSSKFPYTNDRNIPNTIEHQFLLFKLCSWDNFYRQSVVGYQSATLRDDTRIQLLILSVVTLVGNHTVHYNAFAIDGCEFFKILYYTYD